MIPEQCLETEDCLPTGLKAETVLDHVRKVIILVDFQVPDVELSGGSKQRSALLRSSAFH